MKFHTQLKANDIFKFSLAYTYSGLQLILAIAMVAVGVYMLQEWVQQMDSLI